MMEAPDRPLILGHRGAPFDAPENTIAGFERALESGADGVELDVQLTADAVPIVIHDETLQRTTDGHGPVATLTWSQIRKVRSAGEPVPSLEQAARWAAGNGAWLNVEIKAEAAAAPTLSALASAGLSARVIVSSFHVSVVDEVGTLQPSMPRFLLLDIWDHAGRLAAQACGALGVCLGVEAATDPVLAELARAAVPVVVWTVDDHARLEELLASSVLAIITNRPAVAAHLRE